MASLMKDEPAIVVSAAGAVVAWVLGFLVTHGVITDTTSSELTQVIAPIVAAAIMLLIGWATRHLVTPAHKVAQVLESAGLLTDADVARIETMIEDKLGLNASVTAEPAAEPAVEPVAGGGTAQLPAATPPVTEADPGQPANAGGS